MWFFRAVVVLVVPLFLSYPWLLRLLDWPCFKLGAVQSTMRRLCQAPQDYLPLLLVVLPLSLLTVWPGKAFQYRVLIGAGMFYGLSLAVAWNFDRGLPGLLLLSGTAAIILAKLSELDKA